MQNKGKFITIEGIDCSGKSTLIKNLHLALKKKDLDILITKEPGSTELGKTLRGVLQHHPVQVDEKAEYLLFAADRAQHYKQIILPALEQGKIVISDRWADSSVAYQGYGRGLDINIIKTVNAWATNNIKPYLTIYIRLNVDEIAARVSKRNKKVTVFEREKINFWKLVTEGYEKLYTNRNDVLILDGTKKPMELAKLALEAIDAKIG